MSLVGHVTSARPDADKVRISNHLFFFFGFFLGKQPRELCTVMHDLDNSRKAAGLLHLRCILCRKRILRIILEHAV